MEWAYLVAAILFEVGGTLSLRVAALGHRRWYAAVGAGYLAAFSFLALALNEGMSLGIAYGIWAAAGVALTAIGSKFLFKEPLTPFMSTGIALIIGGVLLLEIGATR